MWLKLGILFHYLVFRYFRKFRTREELESWQEARIAKHLGRLRKRSAYLREKLDALGERGWRELPLMNKQIMMDSFDSLNTVGVTRSEAFRVAIQSEETRNFSPTIGDITVGLSSGTSGNRGIFLVSPAERAAHAGAILAKILPGSLFARWSVAFFLRANSNLYSTSQSKNLAFHYFDLLAELHEHVERLNTLKPDLLIGPPSLLRKLAEANQMGGLRIHPRKIVSVAEVLDPIDRRTIEKSFGQIVHQVYQCTEGFLGITCERGVLHLNEDLVHIEPQWLDDSKTRFHPIITDFSRTSQPIVRYVLNDILTLKKEPCACGSVFRALEQIEGRADDCLEFYSLDGGTTEIYPDFIRRCILFADEGVSEYRVTQGEAGRVSVALRFDRPEERGEIQESISRAFEDLAALKKFKMPDIEYHENFPELGLKKLRRIEREKKSE